MLPEKVYVVEGRQSGLWLKSAEKRECYIRMETTYFNEKKSFS
jgi:hypothetical protein